MMRASGAQDAGPGGGESVSVPRVNLLGVRVTARGFVNVPEHARRSAAGLGPVTDPALLGYLVELPVGVAVRDPVTWAETAGLPPGVVSRDDGACAVTRLLEPAFVVDEVIVSGSRGGIRAVQAASLFAGFTRRWVALPGRRAPAATVLEAKLCGVGLLGADGHVILPAERPAAGAVVDGWAWLLWEKAYRRWLAVRAAAC